MLTAVPTSTCRACHVPRGAGDALGVRARSADSVSIPCTLPEKLAGQRRSRAVSSELYATCKQTKLRLHFISVQSISIIGLILSEAASSKCKGRECPYKRRAQGGLSPRRQLADCRRRAIAEINQGSKRSISTVKGCASLGRSKGSTPVATGTTVRPFNSAAAFSAGPPPAPLALPPPTPRPSQNPPCKCKRSLRENQYAELDWSASNLISETPPVIKWWRVRV